MAPVGQGSGAEKEKKRGESGEGEGTGAGRQGGAGYTHTHTHTTGGGRDPERGGVLSSRDESRDESRDLDREGAGVLSPELSMLIPTNSALVHALAWCPWELPRDASRDASRDACAYGLGVLAAGASNGDVMLLAVPLPGR